MKKKLKALLTALLAHAILATSAAAHEPITIRMNGSDTDIAAKLVGTTTYVPFADTNTLLSFGEATISGTPEKMRSTSDALTVNAALDSLYIEASGRYLGGNATMLIDGDLYVPIRSLVKAYDSTLVWHDATRSIDLSVTPNSALLPADRFYNEDDLYWLSRIIHAESQGEPLTGKILVGNVILNRVRSPEFPSTIYDVIFDNQYGVQFTPTANGMIHNTPSHESILAAKLTLDSYSLSDVALYFLNPRLATNFWVPQNRVYLTTVGSHDFYA